MSAERLGPPPVDPLSDVGWARVERNLFSRVEGTVTNAVAAREVRPATRSNWVWLAVPAAAAAAFALAFFSMNGSGTQTADGERSRVVAGASPSTVAFGSAAHVTLEANTAVIMDHAAGKPTAVLEDGVAKFAVAPSDIALTVLAGDMTARTTAATFTVTRRGERADVAVSTGVVEIRFRGHDIKLAADQTWSSERPSDVVDLTPKKH